MSFHNAKKDVAKEITDNIISSIERGDVGQWQCPWTRFSSMPTNVATKKQYKGGNILQLWATQMNKGFTSPLWGSYKQFQALGGQVKKGEKGTIILIFKPYERENNGTIENGFFASSAFVFNLDQVDGYNPPMMETPEGAETDEQIEIVVNKWKANIEHKGDRACYIPSEDKIMMPPKDVFKDTKTSNATINYYSTLFHEHAHWTGHASRCDRNLNNAVFNKGKHDYAFEELIAELTAAFMCARFNINSQNRFDGPDEHTNYIASWLKAMRNDTKYIMEAAKHAQKACEYFETLEKGN